MSFITKLLRKTEPLTTATGETAPLDARALLADAAGRSEIAPPAVDPADAPRPDEPAPTNEPAPMPDDATQPSPPPAAEEADDTAWWEEASPTVVATAPPSTDSAPDVAPDEPPPSDPPLHTEATPVPQTADLISIEDGTRPLTAADMPMLAALRSASIRRPDP